MRFVAVVAVAAVLLTVPVASEAQLPGGPTQLSIAWEMKTPGRVGFLGQLQYNCLTVSAQFPWRHDGSQLVSLAYSPGVGSLNLAKRQGELFVRKGGPQAEDPFDRRGRPTMFTDVGIALNGSRAFLTGRVTRGKATFSAARRVRLAELKGVTFESGTLLTGRRRNEPVPNTYIMGIHGRGKMLKPMVSAFERKRCKNRSRNRLSRKIRAGTDLGEFSIGLRPGFAVGQAGHVLFDAGAHTDNGDEITVQPAAGTTQEQGRFRAPMAISGGLPLECTKGEQCRPTGGTFGIGGGFNLLFNGQTASVANLAATVAGGTLTITGAVNGTPVTVGTGDSARLDLTPEFRQAAGAALGVTISGGAIAIDPQFTQTGPPG